MCESVILETPVLTTDCSGMKDILGESQYGLIVENNDDAIFEGIKKMIDDRNFYEKYVLQVKRRRENFKLENSVKQLKIEIGI